jgi:hypothetical protein
MPDISSAKVAKKMKQKDKERKALGPAGQSKEGKEKGAKDAAAHSCAICKQTFACTIKANALQQHVDSKHSKSAATGIPKFHYHCSITAALLLLLFLF